VALEVLDAIPLRRTDADIRQLIASSLGPLREQARAFDVTLATTIDDDVPARVSVDRAKVAWAIAAVVGNALRYVRHGSQRMPGGSIAVHVSYDGRKGAVALDVQDDGPGIPADRLRRLQTDVEGASDAALGLALVRDVLAAHGGTLDVASSTAGLSRGTTVRFTLPAAGPPR
jgi:signal transduction histidine kinase